MPHAVYFLLFTKTNNVPSFSVNYTSTNYNKKTKTNTYLCVPKSSFILQKCNQAKHQKQSSKPALRRDEKSVPLPMNLPDKND
jgi:hypothetical protein